jgi:hypothetical protein
MYYLDLFIYLVAISKYPIKLLPSMLRMLMTPWYSFVVEEGVALVRPKRLLNRGLDSEDKKTKTAQKRIRRNSSLNTATYPQSEKHKKQNLTAEEASKVSPFCMLDDDALSSEIKQLEGCCRKSTCHDWGGCLGYHFQYRRPDTIAYMRSCRNKVATKTPEEKRAFMIDLFIKSIVRTDRDDDGKVIKYHNEFEAGVCSKCVALLYDEKKNYVDELSRDLKNGVTNKIKRWTEKTLLNFNYAEVEEIFSDATGGGLPGRCLTYV